MCEIVQIPLSCGQVALIDKTDFELINQHKWYALKQKMVDGSIKYYAVSNLYDENGKSSGKLRMHRFLLGLTRFDKILVDHIDNNSLNNCMNNLRLCNNSENKCNSRLGGRNKSGIKGVFYRQKRKKWVASIQINRQSKHLGHFLNWIDAAKAYDEAAIKYHGEFACTNKMMGLY